MIISHTNLSISLYAMCWNSLKTFIINLYYFTEIRTPCQDICSNSEQIGNCVKKILNRKHGFSKHFKFLTANIDPSCSSNGHRERQCI